MTFTLTIDLDNADLQGGDGRVDTYALARIIYRISREVQATPDTQADYASVRDGNGNTVGHWEIK